jgi:hypothetical protein
MIVYVLLKIISGLLLKNPKMLSAPAYDSKVKSALITSIFPVHPELEQFRSDLLTGSLSGSPSRLIFRTNSSVLNN